MNDLPYSNYIHSDTLPYDDMSIGILAVGKPDYEYIPAVFNSISQESFSSTLHHYQRQIIFRIDC